LALDAAVASDKSGGGLFEKRKSIGFPPLYTLSLGEFYFSHLLLLHTVALPPHFSHFQFGIFD